jgi:hypothetical protein
MLAWIPMFALSLPYGANNGNMLLPVLGILPMTFSACTGMLYLTSRKPTSRNISIVIDLFIGCFLLAVFTASCVELAGTGHSISSDQTVLGTLGTAPMMLNM